MPIGDSPYPGFLLGTDHIVTFQNFRLLEGKQILNIDHTNSLGIVSHLYHLGNSENTPENRVPRCQAFLRLETEACSGNTSYVVSF